ncbi:S1 RNA-binding domain-containing protein [Streptomyces malaysiense]|uniref:S1 RNA-binding domain-containing protein n=1 Tax=Streptomyces malaysiense TaxID=1428626 RepID=UPI0030B830DE
MEPGGQTVLAGGTAGALPKIRRPHCGGAETARTGPQAGPPFGVFVQVTDEVTVVVTEVDRERRRLVLSRRQSSSDHR